MKMALQYWHTKKKLRKSRFLTIRQGYHGDTFGAMSVCDPDTGMHRLFTGTLAKQLFAKSPDCDFDEPCTDSDIEPLLMQLRANQHQLAAVILEPIVQGAGGMRFYAPDYLRRVREACDCFNVLLIIDEIATGFGRTGKMFACEHAGIEPDILCLGKALTGGYMSLAATLATQDIADTISSGDPGLFMHGPTFMANPLACSAALASLELLLDSPWQSRVNKIASGLRQGLESCRFLSQVADVRVLGAIGVVELHEPVDMKKIQPRFVDAGVWVRPFNKLVYLMPPFIINEQDLKHLTNAVTDIVSNL